MKKLLKENLSNLKRAFSLKSTFYVALSISLLMLLIFNYTSGYDLTLLYYGSNYLYFQILLEVLISIILGINFSLIYYKMKYFGSMNVSTTSASALGGFLSVLITGCPACSITLASYLGLATIISTFPLAGLELKILALVILLISLFSLLKNLFICKVKNKKEL